MNELMQKINLDLSLQQKVNSLDVNKLKSLAEKSQVSFIALAKCDDVTRLGVCLYYAENYTKKAYLDKGISLDVFYETMQDIAIWCENNDNQGLKNYNWIKNHLNCELFKLGRLQFQMYKCENKTLEYEYFPFEYGDNLLYVHIPQGEKLVYSSCIESIKQAGEFFSKYYSEFEYEYFFCESWLLYNENYAFMSTSSNILQFQSLFEIVYSAPEDKQAIERIFGKKRINKNKYPENTTLQKQAKAYMKAGNKLGIGIGIIDKANL